MILLNACFRDLEDVEVNDNVAGATSEPAARDDGDDANNWEALVSFQMAHSLLFGGMVGLALNCLSFGERADFLEGGGGNERGREEGVNAESTSAWWEGEKAAHDSDEE